MNNDGRIHFEACLDGFTNSAQGLDNVGQYGLNPRRSYGRSHGGLRCRSCRERVAYVPSIQSDEGISLGPRSGEFAEYCSRFSPDTQVNVVLGHSSQKDSSGKSGTGTCSGTCSGTCTGTCTGSGSYACVESPPRGGCC